MAEFEDSGFKGLWLPGRRLTGDEGLAIVARRRFRVDLASGRCEPDESPGDIALAPEFEDEDDIAFSPIERASDIAVEKPLVDVIVRGTAYAPGGRPAPEWEVGVRITGVLQRRLRILGPRTARWVAPKKMLTDKEKAKGEVQEWPPPVFSDPQPIDKLPLSYRYAYGGRARLVLDEETAEQAQELQEEGKKSEERRQRKKEIEAELKAEEEARAAAAKEAASGKKGPADEVARKKADEAFAAGEEPVGEGGTKVVDAATLERLAREDEGEQLEVVSALRLGRDLPDRPEEGAAPEEEAAEAPAEEAEGEGGGAEDALAGVFSEGTQVVDAAVLDRLAADELAPTLEEHEEVRRQRLKDAEGTHIVRTEPMGDVALTDDRWIEEAGAKPEAAPPPKQEESPYPEMPYPANPSGRGFVVGTLKDAVDGAALPCIEDPASPLTPEALSVDLEKLDLEALPAVAGFGPYAPGWFPRAKWWGVMPWDVEVAEAAKAKALEEYDPEDPDDAAVIEAIRKMPIRVMQPRGYNDAHPMMQVERVNGDEDVYLDNLTPDGNLFFRLPGRHPRATLDLGAGEVPVPMTLDTVLIDVEDPAQPVVELTWRGFHVLPALEALEKATRLRVRFGELDQDDWMDAKREEAAGGEAPEGLTRAVKAITDEDLEEGDVLGEEAERRYKDEVRGSRIVDDEAAGPPKDEGGTVVIDVDHEHRLTEDWDQAYRDDKQHFLDEAEKGNVEAARQRDLEIRRKAREKADEEFGIVRDEGEDGEGPKGGKPKGKKG